MSSHESVPKTPAQPPPRTTLAGLPLGLAGRPTSGNGSASHLPTPSTGIVQPAAVRIQSGFEAQLLSAQLAQVAANVAASASQPSYPTGPSVEPPQHSPQTPRVTPPGPATNPSTAFSPFGAPSASSQPGTSAAAMATQQLMQNYQQLLLSMMQQQQQPRMPQYPTPQLDLRQMLMMQQQSQFQQLQQQQHQLQHLAALQQQQQQQQQAAAAAAALAAQQQQQPVVSRAPPDPAALSLQQQRNVADSTAMPPPPLPRRPIPTTISLPQPSTSQLPRRTPPQHPLSLPSTSHQPQPHHVPPMPPTNYRAALETIPELGSLNVKPYYPTHFMRGTKIQLETGGVKNVEDMTARDFHMSGAVAEGLDIELSKVHSIEKASEGNVQTAKVVLIAGEVKARVTIQVFVEHPFFVIGMGWCSVNPTLTKARFGLDCQLLMAGHDCISLVKREDKRHLQPQPHHLNGGSRTATAEPSSTGQTPRRPSLPSTLSSSGNGTGSTSPASTSSVISRQGSMEGSVPPRSDLRSRIKTYQRQSPSAAPPLSQRSTVIRRPRRHRSVPPADPVELRRRAFDRKEKRGERKRRASVSCVKDSHGAFLRV